MKQIEIDCKIKAFFLIYNKNKEEDIDTLRCRC